ncbi:MAG: hypothetical protein PUI26_08135 [Selenomonadaceae bacterium]|nr:hypothetical protein [Selenomonadaceae bacterium]
MMRKCIVFGCGFQGRRSVHKLRKFYDVLCWSDNNKQLWGTEIEELPVVEPERLAELCADETVDIFICTLSFQPLVAQLQPICRRLFVCMWGFIYRMADDGVLYPHALNIVQPYHKATPDEKNILFVQDIACYRTHKIAAVMAGRGYKVFLLYIFAPPESTPYSVEQYQDIYTVGSPDELIEFVNQSEFDVVHSSNEPDFITNILLHTNKKIVFDVHDPVTMSGDEPVTFENLIFENMAHTACDGILFTSPGILAIGKDRYHIGDKPALSLANMPMKEVELEERLPKLSVGDGQIHLVYEGSMSKVPGNAKNMVEQWKKLCAMGLHVHFYTNMEAGYCQELVREIPRLHYEGMASRDVLLRELTKYDAGLFLLNVNEGNRTFTENASPNKIYEYINAGLPIIACQLEFCRKFLAQHHVGIVLDTEGDIRKQIAAARKIKIEAGYLTRNHMTMESEGEKLEKFYQSAMDGDRVIHQRKVFLS